MGPIARLAESKRVAFVCITHLSKQQQKAIHAGNGSGAFSAAARAVWQVSADRDDPELRYFLSVKCNLARTPGLKFRISDKGVDWAKEEVHMSADEALSEDTGKTTARDEAKHWLREFLKGGRQPSSEVKTQAEDYGLSWGTVRNAQGDLGVEPEYVVENGNRFWVWQLPAVAAEARQLAPLPLDLLAG